jgi:hypothetical protein
MSRTADNPLFTEKWAYLISSESGRHHTSGTVAEVQASEHGCVAALHPVAAVVPSMLWLLLQAPSIALISSAALYALMWVFEWNIPAYRAGPGFNPFAWQLLFVFGAWCAGRENPYVGSFPGVVGLAVAYLLFAFSIAMTWYFPRLAVCNAKIYWRRDLLIDKTNLDVLRNCIPGLGRDYSRSRAA